MREIFESESTKVLDDFVESMLGFGKPKYLMFNSTVKDMMPSCWRKKDDETYMCIAKTIGINPEDVVVEEFARGIRIKGRTKLEGYIYDTHMELPIAESIMNEVKEIKVNSKNGLTFITLVLNKPEKRQIKITRE